MAIEMKPITIELTAEAVARNTRFTRVPIVTEEGTIYGFEAIIEYVTQYRDKATGQIFKESDVQAIYLSPAEVAEWGSKVSDQPILEAMASMIDAVIKKAVQ